jgi:glycine cleavage system transcriptional repressor
MAARDFLVISAIGPDRPGLIAELTGFIAERGCNVEESRAVVLAGQFGFMFIISGASPNVAAVMQDLDALEARAGLNAVARRVPDPRTATGAGPGARRFNITASALDREGIVHGIADIVRSHGGNILELETSTYPASTSGYPLFQLELTVMLREHGGAAERLRAALAEMAREENIDLEMELARNEPGGAEVAAAIPSVVDGASTTMEAQP